MLARALPLALAATLLAAAPAVAAPTWLPAKTLQAKAPTQIDGAMAEAPDGTTYVTWTGDVNGHDVTRVRIRPAGSQDFGAPITLTATDGRDALRTDVAVDGSGVATVVWDEEQTPATTDLQVRAATVTPAGAVNVLPGPLSPLGAHAHDPAVGENPAGQAVVAFREGNLSQVVRVVARGGASGGFGALETLSEFYTTFTGELQVGVADNGTAIVAWSRNATAETRHIVEVADRGPTGNFGGKIGTRIVSKDLTSLESVAPSLAVAPDGSAIVVWQENPAPGPGPGVIRYTERSTDGTWSSDPLTVSPPEDLTGNAIAPEAAMTGNGTAIVAWFGRTSADITNTLRVRTRGPNGAGFGPTRQATSTPGFNLTLAANRAGDALMTWNSDMSNFLRSVRRSRTGQVGDVQTVTTGGGTNPAVAIFAQDTGIDDEGNGSSVWSRNLVNGPDGPSVWDIQSAAHDAAPPTLAAVSVPPNGQAGSPIGMAAAAGDRLTPVAVHWDFGDGATADGGAVAHAFGAAGAFTVTVTATDGVGNAASAARPVLATQAPPPPRIDATVQNSWGRLGKNFFLLRLKIIAPPKGSAAQIRCKGRKCPFQSRRFTKFKKGDIVMYKLLGPRKAVKKKNRHFRAKQVIQVRVTAPGYIGKVVKFKLKRGKNPVGKVLCLPPGAAKPSKCT